MRHAFAALGIAVAFVAALNFSTLAAAPASPTHAPTSTKVEPHPEIRAAIAAPERAKTHLQHAAHDFGGHRVEAIGAIDRALEQLKLALQFDK